MYKIHMILHLTMNSTVDDPGDSAWSVLQKM